MKFVDEYKISVKSGKGGPGCVSYRREKFVPRGGPDGGDGGRGGDVIFKSDQTLRSLLDLTRKRHYKAQNGEQGGSQNKSGKSGEDLIITVPVGTVVKNLNGEVLLDLDEDETEVVFLKGGRGGKGNTHYKSSVNQSPDYAQHGEAGDEKDIHLELKLIADVGLLGFPNAGKSTLISKVSAARPKVADYPFTTLTPNLGVVKPQSGMSFVIADIPGIIEGAHAGVGLGHQFLKHIERTKLFLHLIDASGYSGRDPVEDFDIINSELKKYDELFADKLNGPPLSTRPQIVCINKIDVLGKGPTEELQFEFGKRDIKVIPVSGATGIGTQAVINEIQRMLS